ncbi:hypothetical protein LOTGIDRAFT_154940 [Lottia gigantea]|uniref:Uncharacterized protein n=1 Tax=Lottia gigantea TaxID=225164 RepID=V3ZWX7_LOTGI|nr:hypothetical protein LOTGIDRAFT_154940 [Lottia gigantea]ESO85446.1 hypothetical protein LOTGIDRAFT_154940 [Lottia gigantea]
MAEKDLSYCRPLDRSPEKLSPHLSSENVKAITDVRMAVENVRKKFDELNNNLHERDKAVAFERKLKEKAEEKIKSKLVDMYQDDGHVNSELRNRLPRANKTDPLSSTHYHSDDDISFKNIPPETERSW